MLIEGLNKKVKIDNVLRLPETVTVRTPFDAITDFIDCNLDELYLGDYLVTKGGIIKIKLLSLMI